MVDEARYLVRNCELKTRLGDIVSHLRHLSHLSQDKTKLLFYFFLILFNYAIQGKFITWRGNSALNCTRKPISHESRTYRNLPPFLVCFIFNLVKPWNQGWLIAARVVQYSQTGSSRMGFKRVVFHWWNASHYGDLEYFRLFHAARGCILLVHWYDWYDWYEWNIINSIGVPLVKCISLWGLRGLSNTHKQAPVEWDSNDWYSIGEMHLIMGTLEYFPLFHSTRGCILLVHWYDWYHWYEWNIIYSIG